MNQCKYTYILEFMSIGGGGGGGRRGNLPSLLRINSWEMVGCVHM